MRLDPAIVSTSEIKRWQGLHLLHFAGSSCSQKVRILMREKRLDYISHPINLARNQNVTPWFLGINPRGVVPVLVHDGDVHVESNDIMEWLDALDSPMSPLFPQTEHERGMAKASLELEDSMHMDLRNLTMAFIYPRFMTRKSAETLRRYEHEGATNAKRAIEVQWWRDFAEQGVSREAVRRSEAAYRAAFEQLDARLRTQNWLIGDRMSVLDIAWYISVNRLGLAGYPLERHPALAAWYNKLRERPAFVDETKQSLAERCFAVGYRAYRKASKSTLSDWVT
jgi:glutathione S-transferase